MIPTMVMVGVTIMNGMMVDIASLGIQDHRTMVDHRTTVGQDATGKSIALPQNSSTQEMVGAILALFLS
jgi:hypothetical protein